MEMMKGELLRTCITENIMDIIVHMSTAGGYIVTTRALMTFTRLDDMRDAEVLLTTT